MKEFLEGIYKKPQIVKRFIICLIAVIIMGICVSWLNLIDWGMDPCSVFNMAVSEKIGLSFGNWQALLNCCLFILVFILDKKNIGFGTVLNMFVVGYSCDFMNWLRGQIWPDLSLDAVWQKVLVMVIAITVFVIVASIYMTVDLGTAPYDSIIFIIANKISKFPFRVVRIAFELIIVFVAFLITGKIGVVSIAMALTLGPVVQWMGGHVENIFFKESNKQ